MDGVIVISKSPKVLDKEKKNYASTYSKKKIMVNELVEKKSCPHQSPNLPLKSKMVGSLE